MIHYVLMAGLILNLVGCSTMKQSVTVGALSGAGAGAASGLLHKKENRGSAALISAGVGALVGGVAAYFIHDGLDKRDSEIRKKTLFNLESHGISTNSNPQIPSEFNPMLTSPGVEREKLDWRIDGDKLYGPQDVWIITDKPQWVVPSDSPKKEKMRK